MPVLPVRGAELHYEDTGGPGEPILFRHGFRFDGRLWRRRWPRCAGVLVKTLPEVLIRPDIRAVLAAVTAPTLIIAGGADLSFPPRLAEDVHDLIAGSRSVQLPGDGHSAPVEDPHGVTQAMLKFLTGLPAMPPV